jgi:hypothetical protein
LAPILAVVFALPGSASAATWSPAQTLSAAGATAERPQVAFDPAGNALAVWFRPDGANDRVQAAFRPAGGSFGPAQDLSAAGADAFTPRVAFDPAGNAIVVWSRPSGGSRRIQASFRPAGGNFEAAQNLSPAGGDAFEPQIAIDASGNALAAWRRFDGADYRVQAAFRPAGGAFGAASTLSAAGGGTEGPRIAFAPAGNALVVWRRFNGANFRIQARPRSAAGAYGVTQNLSPLVGNAQRPEFAFDGSGNALVVWPRDDGANLRAQARFRSAAGALAGIQTLSAAGGNAFGTQVAMDEAGNALVLWSRFDGADFRVQARLRAPGGGYGATHGLSAAGGGASESHVAFDTGGNALTVWRRDDGANNRIQARFLPAGGSFEPVQTLSAPGGDADLPRVAFDAAGNALAVWTRDDGANDRVQASFLPAETGSPGTPSNEFSFGKLKRNRKKGTAKQTVIVPGPGELVLAKTKKLKPAEKRADAAGKVKLRIKPKRRTKRKLNRNGKAKLKANVTYTPDGGGPNTKSKKLKLKKRR